MNEAITKSEEKHACEIVFVIEESQSLAWIFASVEKRADFMFKKIKLNKLSSNKGILIYLELLDNQLEIRMGNEVKIPKENWEKIIEEGVEFINGNGIHNGCIKIVQRITDELVKYEPNSNINDNEISNELIIK